MAGRSMKVLSARGSVGPIHQYLRVRLDSKSLWPRPHKFLKWSAEVNAPPELMVGLRGEPALPQCLLGRWVQVRIARAIISVFVHPDIERQIGGKCLPRHGNRHEQPLAHKPLARAKSASAARTSPARPWSSAWATASSAPRRSRRRTRCKSPASHQTHLHATPYGSAARAF